MANACKMASTDINQHRVYRQYNHTLISSVMLAMGQYPSAGILQGYSRPFSVLMKAYRMLSLQCSLLLHGNLWTPLWSGIALGTGPPRTLMAVMVRISMCGARFQRPIAQLLANMCPFDITAFLIHRSWEERGCPRLLTGKPQPLAIIQLGHSNT